MELQKIFLNKFKIIKRIIYRRSSFKLLWNKILLREFEW